MLRCDIGGDIPVTDQTGRGGNVDDAAIARLRHAGQHLPDAQKRAQQVDLHHAHEEFRRRALERRAVAAAGVVDQDRDRAAFGDGLRERFLDGGLVSRVGGDRSGGDTEPPGQIRLFGLQRGGRPAEHRKRGATGRQSIGDRRADTPAAAGHQRVLSFEQIGMESGHRGGAR